MAYLYKTDYKTYIQGDYLRQLTQADDNKRAIQENASLQVIISKLTQKYDLNEEFKDLEVWDSTKTYGAGDRVYVDVSADGFVQWVTATAYAVGDSVYYNGYGYVCITANSDVTFTPAKWTSVGAQYTIYYGAYPDTCTLKGQPVISTLAQPYAPVFNYKNVYKKDDVVFWKGNTYVCNSATALPTQQVLIQANRINPDLVYNVFPDDPVNNADGQYWTDETAYVIEAGTVLTDSAWVRGDNRNQLIKDAMVKITVFLLSPLIAPMNRPEQWLEDYRDVLRRLKSAALGEETLLLPLKQPQYNQHTYYGGNPKRINFY